MSSPSADCSEGVNNLLMSSSTTTITEEQQPTNSIEPNDAPTNADEKVEESSSSSKTITTDSSNTTITITTTQLHETITLTQSTLSQQAVEEQQTANNQLVANNTSTTTTTTTEEENGAILQPRGSVVVLMNAPSHHDRINSSTSEDDDNGDDNIVFESRTATTTPEHIDTTTNPFVTGVVFNNIIENSDETINNNNNNNDDDNNNNNTTTNEYHVDVDDDDTNNNNNEQITEEQDQSYQDVVMTPTYNVQQQQQQTFTTYDRNDLLLNVDDSQLPLWMRLEERLNVHPEAKPVHYPLPPSVRVASSHPELQQSKYPHLQEYHRQFYEPFTVLEREDPYSFKSVQFKPLENHPTSHISHNSASLNNSSSANLLTLTLTNPNIQSSGNGKSIVDSFFKALYHLDSMASNSQLGKDQVHVIQNGNGSASASLNDLSNDSSHDETSEVGSSLSPLKGSLKNLKEQEGLDGKRKGSIFALKFKHQAQASSSDNSKIMSTSTQNPKMLLDGYDSLEVNTSDLESHNDQSSDVNRNESQTPVSTTSGAPGGSDPNQVQEEDTEEQYLKKLSLVEFSKHCSAKRRVKQFDFLSGDSTFDKPPLISKKIPSNMSLASPTGEEKPPVVSEDGKLNISDTEILPESTTRLMSCLKPNFKYRPIETSMCFRQPQNQASLAYPIKKRTQLVISCHTPPKFERPVSEIHYFSMALYDLERGSKISEDFHFHFLLKEQIETLSPWVQNYLKTMASALPVKPVQQPLMSPRSGENGQPQVQHEEQKALFTITYPNDQIYLVIQVYRLPTGSMKDALKLYKRDTKQSEINDVEKQYNELKQQVAHFRQAILFGYTPLFSKRGNVYQLTSTKYELKPMYSIEGFDFKTPFDAMTMIRTIQKEKKLKNITQIDGGFLLRAEILKNHSNANKQPKHNRHRSIEHNLHPIIGSSGNSASLVTSPQSYENQLTDESGNLLVSNGVSSSLSSSSPSPLSPSNSLLKERLMNDLGRSDSMPSSPLKGMIDHEKTAHDDENSLETDLIRVQELPIQLSKYPNMEVLNHFFFNPIVAQFEKTFGGKNIFCEVLYRESDSEVVNETTGQVNAEPRIMTRFSRNSSKYDFSCVSYDEEKQPHFYDEFKIDIPCEPRRDQHVLVVFYHLDVDNKKSKKLNYVSGANDIRKEDFGTSHRAVLGYAFMELNDSKKFDSEGYSMFPQFRKHTFPDEITIYKELPANYLKDSEEKLKNLKIGKLKVRSHLVTTIDPSDEIITLFFSTMYDLQNVPDYQKPQVLTFLCDYVFPQFNKIDFKVFMPHLPVVLNMLFGLMARVSAMLQASAVSYIIEKVEIATFEQILVCLRGCYHFLSETNPENESHSRLNVFFSSYTKYILTEPKGAKYPLFSILLRLMAEYLEVPETEKMAPAKGSDYLNDLSQMVKKSRQKKENMDNVKQQIDQRRNQLSEHDPIRFSWFIFDVIIKSMTIFFNEKAKKEDSASQRRRRISAHDEHELDYPISDRHILNRLRQLTDNMVVRIYKLLLASGIGRQNIGIGGNRNLALFLRDLIPFIPDKQLYIEHLIDRYFQSLDGIDERKLRLKAEFIAILTDYDYYIPFNLHLLRLFSKGEGDSVESTATTTEENAEYLMSQEVNSKQVTFSSILIELFYDVVKSGNDKLLIKISKILLDHFCKLDYDSRYQEDSRRAIVTGLYIEFVDRFLENDENLTRFKNDEIYVVLSSCIMWILRGLSKDKLLRWWKSRPFYVMLNLITFLEHTTVAFNNLDFSGKMTDDSILRTEIACITSYLISTLLSNRSLFDEILPELKTQDENIQMLENIQITDIVLQRQQQIADLFEAKSVRTQPHTVALFFRRISHLLLNFILQLTLRSDSAHCHLIFRQCVLPLVRDMTDQLVVSELYDDSIPKRERVPPVQKKHVEQKWRWLLGSVILHWSFNPKLENQIHDLVRASLELLLRPMEKILKEKQTNATGQADEDGDVILDEDGTIRAATFNKLVERMLEINISEGDSEEHGKFKHIFQITYGSFTTPLELLTILSTLYQTPNPNQNIIRIRVEQFLCDWIRDSFHEFDNLVIAELVRFLIVNDRDLKTNTKKKIRRYAIKNLLNFKQEHIKQKGVQDCLPQLPKGILFEELEKPVVDIKEWRIKKSQRKNYKNPFDRSFDLLAWPPVEIARQMTLIDAKLFRKIEAREFFDNAWADKDYKYELAPTICAITDRTNSISYWVRNRILMETNPENRKKVYKRFLDIMRELYLMNNFTSVMAISSGLNSAPISRLRAAKEGISKDDVQLIEDCGNLFQQNYSLMRKRLESLSIERSPCIPFTGAFLTDVTFTKDGNQDFIDHVSNPDKKLVNFKKRRTYYKTIRTVQDLKTSLHYPFKPIPFLEYILKEDIFHNLNNDDKELYNLSIKVEPRK
ncbi:rasGEF domain-containing protein [Naegleria gruberi]|uniref:RasGEF domain-containing protein n=1 Tax=Naegleria gruberi TaxID=5762 RepID=D2VFV9_NAEGR|nr:rasGEF domain-containing protein [Naegleria gruberi]EFC44150.1 rasGEF domain-containing protein [Naegleria gruberi]|eukprot:XP_002676894.1 rasGEF domain-containing protein [Naegleria gruberi strain NEG-M]